MSHTDKLASALRALEMAKEAMDIQNWEGDQIAAREVALATGLLREVLSDDQRNDAIPHGHAMLPNDSHPGPGCSCRDCLKAYPEAT